MLAWQLISLPRGIRNTASGGPRGPRCQHKKSVDLGKCWNSHSWWLFFVWHSDGFAWRFGGTPIPLDAYGCIMMHHDASSFSPWKMTKYVFSIFRYQPQIPHQVGYIYIYTYVYIYTHMCIPSYIPMNVSWNPHVDRLNSIFRYSQIFPAGYLQCQAALPGLGVLGGTGPGASLHRAADGGHQQRGYGRRLVTARGLRPTNPRVRGEYPLAN